ncbi:MAG: protoporphyrinogen oxidase HemJ [Porticoccaceae bacterium]|jgi:putative membrane protein|nr:protoporphyrinogen oxidase HemJ [Porticoccaceae bacterium]MEA3301231.1 protoporphyrinogen oxidase HemJ [Pseudomonadota bacterium]HLS98745.1 protoporphyrinogen oxidase HemJ [Porticoccaceae bacterium]
MYVWIEAFHIISVVCWFAALFYLPRLFVYHAMAEDEISNERFKVMERKLYRGIATPSMFATLVLGGAMAARSWDYFSGAGWFHAKLALVLALVVYHHLCLYHLKRFRDDTNSKSHVYFRWFNEVPVIMLVGIVILVVVKPF